MDLNPEQINSRQKTLGKNLCRGLGMTVEKFYQAIRRPSFFIPARNLLLVGVFVFTGCNTNVFAQFGFHTRGNANGVTKYKEQLRKKRTYSAQRLVTQEDARINDLFFLSRSHGWAVGDRGVIWHTIDGGKKWVFQNSNTLSTLESVWFVDPQRGWAVGGSVTPYLHTSKVVFLRTFDGGVTWQPLEKTSLPKLKQVKFFDTKHGIVFGNSSSLFPTGVARTSDGGRSWQPVSVAGAHRWIGGDFTSPTQGILAGAHQEIVSLTTEASSHAKNQSGFSNVRIRGSNTQKKLNSQVTLGQIDKTENRSWRRLALAGEKQAWLVGDGGLVLQSNDFGRSWQPPKSPLPPITQQTFDFKAIATYKNNVWIGGSPGTLIYHTANNGKSWTSHPTGHRTPIYTITFVDSQHGWAAGELGSILSTNNGGKTWRLQRCGGKRVALYATSPTAAALPLELIAQAGAAEGYLAMADVLFHEKTDALGATPEVPLEERLHQAVVASGGTTSHTAWQFPLPDPRVFPTEQLLLNELSKSNDPATVEKLTAYYVRQFRMWQPDVILVPGFSDERKHPLQYFLNQVVLQAVLAAGDETRYLDLYIEAGLVPWKVKRVVRFEENNPQQRGAYHLNTNDFIPRLQRSLFDFTMAPTSLLQKNSSAQSAAAYECHLVSKNRAASVFNSRGLFSGLVGLKKHEIRRPFEPLPLEDIAQARKMTEKRNAMQKLLKTVKGDPAWAAQVASLTGGMRDNSSAELLLRLAEGYRLQGRLDMAAETYYMLARRYPNSPLVDYVFKELVQYYASGETALRLKLRKEKDNLRDQLLANVDTAPLSVGSVTEPGLKMDKPKASHSNRQSAVGRYKAALKLASYLKRTRPDLYADPDIRFPLASVYRKLGLNKEENQQQLLLHQIAETNPWRSCLEAERWLQDSRRRLPEKQIGYCLQIHVRPKLDGVLNEACWQPSKAILLRSATLDSFAATKVWFLFDTNFMYLAIEAPKHPNVLYPTSDLPRTLDSDLRKSDRVTIKIDTDRDYTTAFQLSVDHQGRPAELLWGDKNWNPNWFIAKRTTKESWFVEIAIPLAELSAIPLAKLPKQQEAWGVEVYRTLPGVGIQSWGKDWKPTPAGKSAPGNYGLMLFQSINLNE